MSATPSPKASAASPDSAGAPDLLPGYPRLWLRTVASTNDAAKRWALDGAPDGALVTALDQTAGRGQRGNRWLCPPGLGLPVSFVLRPARCPADRANVWAVYGAMTALDALRRAGLTGLAVKYPNDILCNGRKICGVLAEPRIGRGRIEFVVLGIGINLLQTPDDFPPDLRPRATSCLAEGRPVAPAAMLDFLATSLRAARSTAYPRLRAAWIRAGAKPPR